ncbi:septal ring lytic transglycosylase RlpA family protein (plasmid) [Polymorphobacter sp. PAMC 29334]|uniref:septal ring lytic transglycosylase RlpA family protein n=1 Tax=Polymorphobacter sp. PAMC 29334 TaxID=2862331 RepID=UPI001C79A74F|nr:septal ring lytic transglycosylase RlpA family protein [Polymorphobacter sp. PAMC 29334]QYE32976.1 septal ring lytic transglycosylase RlpA family protein [Polymorphobacter sp. PAMC 29334]
MGEGLPSSGKASTYSDFFIGKQTSSGETYAHAGFTAALLPRARWYAVPMGTRLKLTRESRSIVVKVNDRGAGDGSMERVLDLSRAAYAYLLNRPADSITDANASLITLSAIEQVPATTVLGPK